MKKFVCCISLLLAAFSTTAMAQDEVLYNILKIEGMVPTINGTTIYYIKNVGTGLHVSYGAEYGKHCKESRAAHPFVLAKNSDGTVALGSLAGYLESESLWMDWAQADSKWTLQPVGGEYVNQYYIVSSNGLALTSVGNSAGLLRLKELEYKASQRWIFLTEEEIRTNRMPKATPEKPFDVTPFIKGAAFDLADGEAVGGNAERPYEPEALKGLKPYLSNYWKGQEIITNGYWPEDGEEWDPNLYNYCGEINGEQSAYTVTYQVTLPAGTYSYSFEGFYEYVKREQVKVFGAVLYENINTYTQTMSATVKVADDTPYQLKRYGKTSVFENKREAAIVLRDNDRDYYHRSTFTLDRQQTVSIVISKGATTSGSGLTTYPNKIYLDNFTLLYFGPQTNLSEEEIDDDALFDSYLDANIDEFIESLPEDQQEAAREALNDLDRDNINSTEDYYDVLNKLEETVTEVEQELKEEALGGITTDENGNIVDENGDVIDGGNADISSAIKNPSFEKSTLTGWTIDKNSTDTGVRHKNSYTTTGINGNYLFNTRSEGVQLTQSITGLPNGVYKMTVSLASDAGNTVILIGNDSKREVTLTKGEGTFEDFSVKFKVTNGTATIGVVGGGSQRNWYKTDNFRLELINDHLVLDENDTDAMLEKLRAADYWYANVTLKRPIKNTNWSTFVVPFDIPASLLSGWEVKELAASEMDENGNITLEFVDATGGIKAGVPYMVRNLSITAQNPFTGLTLQDINISTTLNDVETDHIAFRGVWTKGYVPIGSYFISGNKFYRSVNTTNRDNIKGFRAYLEPKDQNKTRSLGYRFGAEEEEGATGIDNAQLASDNEAAVVAIYTLDGVRIDEMQQGVNILQMSDGSVVKVVIK